MSLVYIIAQAASSPTANGTATNVVGVIGIFFGLVSTYVAVRGQTKQVEISSEDKERDAILKERDQMSNEWKALREYTTVQLSASQKEIETLRNHNLVLENALISKNKTIAEREQLLSDHGIHF